MTDVELTRLSTIAWTVATSALFVLLARWSTGGSWGITSGIVDGVRGWSHSRGERTGAAPGTPQLPPLVLPAARRHDDRAATTPDAREEDVVSEIEELPSRRI